MKAIRIHEDGGPEVLRYEDVPDPSPATGEVLVELRAASLNHLDVWIRKGLPSVPKPRILGADGAGVIAGTDERVVINPGIMTNGKMHIVGETMDGTHAELIAIPRDYLHPIPGDSVLRGSRGVPARLRDRVPDARPRARLQEGEWVLIWGIGGGVATAALAIAKALGAQVGRHVVERREARAGESARRRRRGQPRDGRRRRRRQGGDRRRRARRRRQRRRSDLEAHARRGAPGRADRRLRRDHRPEPAGGPAPRLVEAALDPRLVDGIAGGLPGCLGPDRRGEGEAGRRQGVPARRGARGARAARGRGSSSARSCSQFPA